MSDQNRNFTEASCDNFSNNYVYRDNIFGYPNPPQNSSCIISTNMFTRPPPPPPPPPPVFPNYHQMAPPPLFPPPHLSVPPPGVSSQPMVNPSVRMTCESDYYGNKEDSFVQFHSSTYFQNRLFQGQNVCLPVSNLNHGETFCEQTQLPGGVLNQNDNRILPKSQNEIDEYWIKNWLKDIGKTKEESADQSEENDQFVLSNLKIYEVKEKINEITKLLAELENSCKSLPVIYKSLSDGEWISRCAEIDEKKKKLSNLLRFFSNNEKFVQSIKWKLDKRRKKRKRQKRKREEWKQEKIENSVKRQLLHQNIDRWLEDMKDTVERGKRDEELKREADSVLADVTCKKTEAKRQIALLSALLKLREARVTAQKAIGQSISQQQTDAFNSVIERLKSLWTKQLKEYSLEEQGLKVMLNEAAAVEKNNESLRKKEILRDWEMAIFGSSKTSEYQPRTVDKFISVRKQWDHFVTDIGTIMSSSIPPGWILPVKSSDSNWMKFTKTHKT